jgi:hypothetical protein
MSRTTRGNRREVFHNAVGRWQHRFGLIAVTTSLATSVACGGERDRVAPLTRAFGGAHAPHRNLTRVAIDQARALLNAPIDLSPYEAQVCNGNLETDSSSNDTVLARHYGADTFNSGSMQHLHFNRDWVSQSSMRWVQSARDTCVQARERIIAATTRAINQWRSNRREQAAYWLGHATHTIQDSFARAHTMRDGGWRLQNVCSWELRYTPPGVCDHGSIRDGDKAWNSSPDSCASNDYNCVYGRMRDNAQAATRASAGYLALATRLITNPGLIPRTELELLLNATTAYGGHMSCSLLSASEPLHNTPLWEDDWTSGWTSMVPFQQGNTSYLLAYKNATGRVAIDRMNAGGAGTTNVWLANWTSGWTSFVPFTLGGQPHYLAYKIGSGRVAIDRINAGGQGVTNLFSDEWTTGWSALAPFAINGQPHILAYKSGTGRVAIDRINPDGRGTSNVWTGSWATGISSISVFRLALDWYAFTYSTSTGAVAIRRLAADGRGASTTWSSDWSLGWSSIAPLVLGGSVHLISYKSGIGTVAVDRVRAGGSGTVEVRRGDWTMDWSQLVPFRFANSAWQYLLAYKNNSGRVAVDRIE